MSYLVGDLIKEIEAGEPVTSFPKWFKGPPKLEKEKEAIELDEKEAKAPQDNQTTKPQGDPQEDWVKKKWARYHEPNKTGEVKPNFNKMTFPQFEEYMKDAQEQGKHKVAAASRHMGIRDQLVQEQQKDLLKTKAVLEGSRKSKAIAPGAELHTVSANAELHPRKKLRVEAYITKGKYLRK